MPKLDIAVVIVSYKTAKLTIDCLHSIQRERMLTDLSIRVVVVDNASGDLPFLEEAVRVNDWSSWVTLALAPTNGGFAYGNNLGFARAYTTGRPDYLYLLNPDTQIRRGAIDILVDFLETHPNAGIAGSSFELPDGRDWPIAFRFPTLVSELRDGLKLRIVDRLLEPWRVARPMTSEAQPTDWISGASMLIRSTVLNAIGGLDENYFLYFEETDYCYRARRAGYSTWYVPQSRVMHMIGQSTAVTDATRALAPMPSYWFESRRRFFAVTYGIPHAVFIDIAAILACGFGVLKRYLLRRPNTPHFVRDMLRYSVLLPWNARLRAARCFIPPKAPVN